MELPQEIIGNPVFSRLDASTREQVARLAVKKELKKGSCLVSQGEVWPYLFLLTRGQLVAEKNSFDGRTFIAASFKPGEVFWGVSFFIDDLAMPANIKALEDASLYLWAQRVLRPIIKSNGALSWEINKLVVSRMQFVSEIIESMTFHPIAVRLARLLIGIADGAGSATIERNLTLDEMAARIGSTREMVCRLLYKFSDEGLIKITRTEFSVTDAENLYKRAQKQG